MRRFGFMTIDDDGSRRIAPCGDASFPREARRHVTVTRRLRVPDTSPAMYVHSWFSYYRIETRNGHSRFLDALDLERRLATLLGHCPTEGGSPRELAVWLRDRRERTLPF